MPLPVLEGERLTLRPAAEVDADPIAALLVDPDVAEWWGRYDLQKVRDELEGTFVIDVEGEVAGWLQAHEETEPDYRHVAFDLLLGERFRGRGLGSEALRTAIRHFVAAGHHRFTIDPSAANERAIRSYAAVGFKPVGIMRGYQRRLDGEWHDSLLMDLIASELEG